MTTTDLLPFEIARQPKPLSGFTLPGKTAKIAFGVDREHGRWFRTAGVAERHLNSIEITALLQEHGEPSEQLYRVVAAFSGSDHGPRIASALQACSCEMMDIEEGMFEKGKSVSVEDLPKELQKNVKNPPPAVQKVKKQMEEGMEHEESMMFKTNTEDEELLLPVEVSRMRGAGQRERIREARAPGGLYGYTKRTQHDVEASVRKAQKVADRIARSAFARDERVQRFFEAHAKRANSSTAKLLVAAIKSFAPKVAGDKEATDKVARGLYGHPAKTARLGLSACNDLRTSVGEIAFDLHQRRLAKYDRITAFLKEHSKQARCNYSRMLLACYPDAPKVAKQELPEALKEHQFKPKDEESKDKEEAKGKKKAAEEFDPEEIAETESGALEKDPDEVYMESFTEQEYTELSDKQESGAVPSADKSANAPDSVQGWLEWQE